MKLQEYLNEKNLSHAKFARLIQASVSGVGKWARDERTPRKEIVRRINEATGGQVAPADFFGAH